MHKAYNGGRLGQIDYFLAPKDITVMGSWVFDVPCATDHRAVAMSNPMLCPDSRTSFKRSAKTWFMPDGDSEDPDSQAARFSSRVREDLCTLEC